MDKTPISILQEIAMKHVNVALPVYTEITSDHKPLQSLFVIEVKWKTYTAKGYGTTKKKAKQSAASMLLLSLENISPVHDENLGKAFVNYVGELNDYVALNKLPNPTYTIVSITGPSHMLTFTMSCTVGNICEEASAVTKKQAKHEVSMKVLERLKKMKSLKKYENFKDKDSSVKLKIDDLKIYDSNTEKAITLYCMLKNKTVSRSNLLINEYHQLLTDVCNNIPQTQKDSLINMCAMKTFSEDIQQLKSIISDTLKTTVEKITFKSNGDQFIIGLRLFVEPIILQIGMGETMEQAEYYALYKLFQFIAVFLRKNECKI